MNMELRRCLCEPIPEIEIAACRLDGAVSAHLLGERELAAQLFCDANDKAIRRWLDSIWGKGSKINRKLRTLPPPVLAKCQRPKLRFATAQSSARFAKEMATTAASAKCRLFGLR